METVAIALILMLAVVISGTLTRMSPIALPLPLVQIALGAAIASVADLGVVLEPDLFFLLFLPPLLFLDGWRIPKEGLFRDKGTILELALGLVVAAYAQFVGTLPVVAREAAATTDRIAFPLLGWAVVALVAAALVVKRRDV